MFVESLPSLHFRKALGEGAAGEGGIRQIVEGKESPFRLQTPSYISPTPEKKERNSSKKYSSKDAKEKRASTPAVVPIN